MPPGHGETERGTCRAWLIERARVAGGADGREMSRGNAESFARTVEDLLTLQEGLGARCRNLEREMREGPLGRRLRG